MKNVGYVNATDTCWIMYSYAIDPGFDYNFSDLHENSRIDPMVLREEVGGMTWTHVVHDHQHTIETMKLECLTLDSR